MNFNMSGFTISPELKTSFYIFKPSYLDSILIKYWCVHIKFICVQYFYRFNFARNKFWICKMISSLCDLPIYYQHLARAVISRFSSCKNSKGLNCSHFLCKMTKRLVYFTCLKKWKFCWECIVCLLLMFVLDHLPFHQYYAAVPQCLSMHTEYSVICQYIYSSQQVALVWMSLLYALYTRTMICLWTCQMSEAPSSGFLLLPATCVELWARAGWCEQHRGRK